MANQLEYNPELRRKDKLRGSYEKDATVDLDGGQNDELKITENILKPEIGEGLLTENIESYFKLKEKIDLLWDKTYTQLIGVKTPVPIEFEDKISEIKKENNLIDNGFSIDDYIWGLDNLKNPSGALLVELWENYHEDVQGSLTAELFADIHEMKNELAHTEVYIQKFLIDKMNIEMPINEKDFLNVFLQEEKKLALKNKSLKKEEVYLKDSYIYSMLNNQKDISGKREDMYNKQLVLDKNKFLNYGLIENNSILETKLIQLDSLTDIIIDNIDKDTFENYSEIQHMMNIRDENSQNSIPYLHKMNLLVKLNVDNENIKKHNIKNTIRNIYSIDNKEKLMNELLVDGEVFDKISLDVSHYVDFYNESMDSSADIFLNQATKSLISVVEGKKEKTKDFFTMEEGESYFRKLKLDNVLEKDDARQTYKQVLEFTK